MAYLEVTDSIVETINLSLNPSLTLFQYYAVGLKRVNDLTGEEIIYEGGKVPNIFIESNNGNNWLSVSLDNDLLSPGYVIINILDTAVTSNAIYAKIYLKYNDLCTSNYIFIVSQLLADIVLYDKTNNNFVFVNAHILNNIDYPLRQYTPVGVVVIPASHNVYGNSKAGVMSLRIMYHEAPDIGDYYLFRYIYYGDVENDTIPNYAYTPQIDNTTTSGDIIKMMYNNFYIPNDYNGQYSYQPLCLHDNNAYYGNNTIAYFTASPYLTDGSRNPNYYKTASPSNNNNALSKFNGKSNTNILCNLATALSDWKTASTITNSYDSGYFPAACCCWRYHTDGTNQGDWYFPAMGELGYVAARIKMISNTLNKVVDIYGDTYAYTFSNITLLSSTTNSNTIIYYIDLTGYFKSAINYKSYFAAVIAFTNI